MREIIKKRGLRSKKFDLGDRKKMLRLGIKKPLHYISDEGKLEDIDLTPTLDRGQHFISKAPYRARIGRNFPGYRYTGERGTISAELVAVGGNSIARREPEYKDKRFLWRGIAFETDCAIIPRNARLDAVVTLHSENAPRSFAWEVLGDKFMMRPVVGRDAAGRPLEIEQSWNGDRLDIVWTGQVMDRRSARRKKIPPGPVYPVWIDPTVNEAITTGADDATSFFAGASSLFDASATVGNIGSASIYDVHAGFRFQGVALPNISEIASINSAILTLDVTLANAGASVRIYGNDVDDAAVWADPGNLMKNITKTTAFANFSGFGSTGQKTIDVSSIIEEIITRTGWASGNDLALVAFPTGSTYANVAMYEHASRQEAQLDIVYTEPGGAAAMMMGL